MAGRDCARVALCLLEHEHLRAALLDERVDHGGEPDRIPAADGVARTWVNTNDWSLGRQTQYCKAATRVCLLRFRHRERGREAIRLVYSEWLQQRQPIRNLVLVLLPARQHVGEKVCAAAKVVA